MHASLKWQSKQALDLALMLLLSCILSHVWALFLSGIGARGYVGLKA